jgi:hypothetical protein
MTEINEYTMAEAYQPLFDFMSMEYGKILLVSEMDEIISVVDKVNENLVELWRVKCDVVDCNATASSQGMYYKESGYWCLCSKHSQQARESTAIPQMKQGAINREKSRKSDGTLPY